jgi:hypothetical protein
MRYVIIAVSLAIFVMFGCVSEERTQEKWDEFVADNNACASADDCAIVYPGCPLGCYTAVSADRRSAAEAKAASLIDGYERSGRACDYSCLEPPPLVCDAGHCGFGERTTPEESTPPESSPDCPFSGEGVDHGSGTVQFTRDGEMLSYTMDGSDTFSAVQGNIEFFRILRSATDDGRSVRLDLSFTRQEDGLYRFSETSGVANASLEPDAEGIALQVDGDRVFGEFSGVLRVYNSSNTVTYEGGQIDVTPRCWQFGLD